MYVTARLLLQDEGDERVPAANAGSTIVASSKTAERALPLDDLAQLLLRRVSRPPAASGSTVDCRKGFTSILASFRISGA
jgi:hypothetical protein